MKKIIVEKLAPKPAEVILNTPLTGKELVAYTTQSGTICTLHRISAGTATKEGPFRYIQQFGFFNLAYSNDSHPTFVSNDWFESIKKAGATRQLYAFEDYKELLYWITLQQRCAALKEEREVLACFGTPVEQKSSAGVLPKPGPENLPIKSISPEDVDWVGSGQVNHTHRTLTVLYNKINDLIKAFNLTPGPWQT